MIVFDLSCDRSHRFEGWFASAQEYEEQRGRGLIECPVCGSRGIQKLLSAPRLNLALPAEPVEAGENVTKGAPPVPATPQELQALVMKVAEVLVAHTEDVGDQFAREARRIHEGDAPDRPIRGQASAEQAQRLHDDGIEIFMLPIALSPKGPLH